MSEFVASHILVVDDEPDLERTHAAAHASRGSKGSSNTEFRAKRTGSTRHTETKQRYRNRAVGHKYAHHGRTDHVGEYSLRLTIS